MRLLGTTDCINYNSWETITLYLGTCKTEEIIYIPSIFSMYSGDTGIVKRGEMKNKR